MQYKFVGFVENKFVGKPTFLFSTFPWSVVRQQLVFQSIWMAIYTDDCAVVKQAVKYRICQGLVFEHFRPLREWWIRGDDCRFLLVSFRHQLKEQIRCLIIHFQINMCCVTSDSLRFAWKRQDLPGIYNGINSLFVPVSMCRLTVLFLYTSESSRK